MKTLQQHIEEKLVINNNIKTIKHIDPTTLVENSKIYAVDFSSGGVVMPHAGKLYEKVKKLNRKSIDYNMSFISNKADAETFYWEVDVTYDDDYLCYIYFEFFANSSKPESMSLIFTENNKDTFMNLVNSLKPNAEYTLKTIFKRLYIDFDSFCNKYGDEWINHHKYWFSCNKKEYKEFLEYIENMDD